MLSRLFDKLTKTRHLVYVKSVQDFGTGNKLMERIPRDIKNCEKLKPSSTSISSEDVEPKAETDTSFIWAHHGAPSPKPFNLFRAKEWWDYRTKLYNESVQKYDPQKIKHLGNNIAAAYFILQWHGKVKFKNSEWIQTTDSTPACLPSSYHPDFIVVAIDASNTKITYEGLKNIINLTAVKWLSFKGCPYIDDWCIDKMCANFPSLEYFDISDCKNITERGLEAIYKLFDLKTLIVTNHHKSAAFELTCLMLEECNPNLNCQILNSRYSDESEELHKNK